MVTSANSSTLRAQLFRIFEDRTYKPPPLPAVALEMASLASKADVNVGDVVRSSSEIRRWRARSCASSVRLSSLGAVPCAR